MVVVSSAVSGGAVGCGAAARCRSNARSVVFIACRWPVPAVGAAVVWVALLITQIVFLVKNGQTIGKKVMGIRMITSEGEVPSLWRVFLLRWLPFVVTAATIELIFKVRGLGNLIHLVDALLIFQPTRRCLHDLFADTHVIKA